MFLNQIDKQIQTYYLCYGVPNFKFRSRFEIFSWIYLVRDVVPFRNDLIRWYASYRCKKLYLHKFKLYLQEISPCETRLRRHYCRQFEK